MRSWVRCPGVHIFFVWPARTIFARMHLLAARFFAQMFCCEFWIMACSFGLPGARFLLVWAPGGRFLHGRISLAARFLCRCLHAANFGSSSMHAAARLMLACHEFWILRGRACERASKERSGGDHDVIYSGN